MNQTIFIGFWPGYSEDQNEEIIDKIKRFEAFSKLDGQQVHLTVHENAALPCVDYGGKIYTDFSIINSNLFPKLKQSKA